MIGLTIISCSSGDDSSDDETNGEFILSESKFLQANKNTYWLNNDGSTGYWYISESDISEGCIGISVYGYFSTYALSEIDVYIDTPTKIQIEYPNLFGENRLQSTYTISGNTLKFEQLRSPSYLYTKSNNQPPDCFLD